VFSLFTPYLVFSKSIALFGGGNTNKNKFNVHENNGSDFFRDKAGLYRSCSTCYVGRAKSVKFGLHADNMKFSTQNEEYMNIRITAQVCTILPVYVQYKIY